MVSGARATCRADRIGNRLSTTVAMFDGTSFLKANRLRKSKTSSSHVDVIISLIDVSNFWIDAIAIEKAKGPIDGRKIVRIRSMTISIGILMTCKKCRKIAASYCRADSVITIAQQDEDLEMNLTGQTVANGSAGYGSDLTRLYAEAVKNSTPAALG